MTSESLQKVVEDTLVKLDPMGLISMGAPLDEYTAEAREILERISTTSLVDLDSVVQLVYEVFLEFFGYELCGGPEHYRPVAEHIWAALSMN